MALSLTGAQPRGAAAAAKAAAPKVSAYNKPVFEEYVRHLFVWPQPIQVEIGDPVPSKTLPGFDEVKVHASQGKASQDEHFFISKDGQKIVRGSVFDAAQNPFKADLDKLKTEFQPSFGTAGAPVVLVEFSDFECAFCREEAKILRSNLLTEYPKQVRLYFMDFPLDSVHPWAKAAAIAGRCIFRQNPNAFWDYHDWIFEHQGEIAADNLQSKILDFAKGKDLDVLQLTRCMETKATEAEVDKTMALGQQVSVGSTPTLFINGRPLVGATPWNELKRIIDYEIEYQKTAKNAGEDCGCDLKLATPGLK